MTADILIWGTSPAVVPKVPKVLTLNLFLRLCSVSPQFAITDCHTRGDFCWYPGQLSAPPEGAPLCDLTQCQPIQLPNVFGKVNDYPLDEYHLWPQFETPAIAEQWLNTHLENFVTRADIAAVAASGATHMRVPLPHYILGKDDTVDDPVWVVGKRWQAFERIVQWARDYGLQVWPDIHSAPGSQNGFDNSGQQFAAASCKHWTNNATHVQRSMDALQQITARIAAQGMTDVVTGFGLLNEPFKDCDKDVYLDYMERGLEVARANLGPDVYVYVSDMFVPQDFNDGVWWQNNATKYHNTILDTHYYHVFAGNSRGFSPRQHIAMTCQNEYHVERKKKDVEGGIATCCYQDPPHNRIPSTQVRRMVGEWSAALDILPVDKLYQIMDSITVTGVAADWDRQFSKERKDLLLRFVQAQMVTYEAADKGISQGWFYWTLKMEGGAFAEWDFLRGIKEGWIPRVPPTTVASTELFGTCYDLLWRTDDNMTAIEEFPANPYEATDHWMGVPVDDDVILTHGDSLLWTDDRRYYRHHSFLLPRALALLFVSGMLYLVYKKFRSVILRQKGYTEVPNHEVAAVLTV